MRRFRVIHGVWAGIAAGWVFLVFYFSSQPYHKQSIIPWLIKNFTEPELRGYLPRVSIWYHGRQLDSHQSPYEFIEFLFRKGAHLFMYAMLAVILLFMLRLLLPRLRWSAVAIAWLLTFLVASLDEWNQSFSDFRTGHFTDVILDMTGATLGMVLYWLFRIGALLPNKNK